MVKNKIYWQAEKLGDEVPLASGQHCDVAVVGGGMAGLTAAHALADAGKRVVVLEQEFCGSGASGRSSGFITPDSELELSALLKAYGAERAKQLWEFSASGAERIRKTIEQHQFDCDFRVQDSLFVANSDTKFRKRVIPEYEARKKLGYQSTLYVKEELSEVLGSTDYSGGVRYLNTFGIDSYAYCQALKRLLVSKGVSVYEKSPVTAVCKNSVGANGFTVQADHIVLCTDRFLPKLGVQKPHIYQAQTFLGLTKPLSNEAVRVIFPKDQMMVWDTDLIYQYYRIVRDNRLLIGASSLLYTYLPLEVAHPQNVIGTMVSYMQKKYPNAPVELEYFWPGMIGVSKDFLPIAGRDRKNPSVHFIGAAAGLPWASALGNYIAEKILHGREDMDSYFSPDRKYPVGKIIQGIIRKPLAFALSHGIVKYFE